MPASGVLRSHESSTYPRGYASGSCFACGLADRHFEHLARGCLPIHQTDKIDQTDPPVPFLSLQCSLSLPSITNQEYNHFLTAHLDY